MDRVRIVGWVVAVAALLTACGGSGLPSPGNSGGDDLAVELAGSLSPQEAAAAALGVNVFEHTVLATDRMVLAATAPTSRYSPSPR